jgi:hypothetical protein
MSVRLVLFMKFAIACTMSVSSEGKGLPLMLVRQVIWPGAFFRGRIGYVFVAFALDILESYFTSTQSRYQDKGME